LSLSRANDAWLGAALRSCALAVSVILLLIVAFITQASWSLLQTPAAWLGSAAWHPLAHSYGMLAMLAATIATSALALALAVPLGLGVALWGRFYAPAWLGRLYRTGMGVMAAIPSVVYGLWGLTVLVPLINRLAAPGTSVLAGAIILGWMLLPIIVLQADVVLNEAARRHLNTALALGLSTWGAIRRVLLPASLPQLRATVLLQAGRAVGETMALLMVCGNVVQWPASLFAPVRTLTANIALEMAYATGQHQRALYASGWLLMLLVLLLMAGARWFDAKGAHAAR
jgi:phosphate transport system permease protein